MGAIASQITSLTIVYSTVCSDADQRKHQSSASLAFVWGIHRGPVNSPHKWPVTLKMLPFDDVIISETHSLHFECICGGQQMIPIERLQTKFETCFSYRESILQGCFWYVDISVKLPIFCKLHFVHFFKIITCVCWFRFHWSLFLGAQLRITYHGFGCRLGAELAKSHYLHQ